MVLLLAAVTDGLVAGCGEGRPGSHIYLLYGVPLRVLCAGVLELLLKVCHLLLWPHMLTHVQGALLSLPPLACHTLCPAAFCSSLPRVNACQPACTSLFSGQSFSLPACLPVCLPVCLFLHDLQMSPAA